MSGLEQAVESSIKETKGSKARDAMKMAGKIAAYSAIAAVALPAIAVGGIIGGTLEAISKLASYPFELISELYYKIRPARISYNPAEDQLEKEGYLCDECHTRMEWYGERASAHDAGSAGYWCEKCGKSIELYVQ